MFQKTKTLIISIVIVRSCQDRPLECPQNQNMTKFQFKSCIKVLCYVNLGNGPALFSVFFQPFVCGRKYLSCSIYIRSASKRNVSSKFNYEDILFDLIVYNFFREKVVSPELTS